MSELVDRLRESALELYFSKPELLVEAADRIESLEADLRHLTREVERCPFHGWVLP